MAFILEADNLTKYYGDYPVFTNLRFSLKEGEKAALVGANGVGKTTLFNCLASRDTAYEGSVKLAPYATIGYLEQIRENSSNTLLATVMEVFSDIFAQRERIARLELAMSQAGQRELEDILKRYGNERELYESAGGFASEAMVRRVLSGLGFREEQFTRPVSSFSGGEKTRIGLARILAREHSLLFLDEPTNHLDMDSIEWLEGFLKDYRGAIFVISHDRYFLDRVTETTFDMASDGQIKRYNGCYSVYAAQKEDEAIAHSRAYEKQQVEILKTEDYITRFKAGVRSKQARGRQTRLARVQRLEKPERVRGISMGKTEITGTIGEWALVLDDVAYSYSEDKHLFSGLNASVRSGERVALLGPNGAGKTTILKLIMGFLKPKAGTVYLGPSAKPAYFDQEHQGLSLDNTVLNEIIYQYGQTVEEARSNLARFLFFTEELDQKISSLSGGERGRLSLLKLTLDKGNFLVLDEPTNHLDIQTREIMEDYLADYPGTIIMVSHDRYFIDSIAERVLELSEAGLTSYPGNYTDYKERKARYAQQRMKPSDESKAKPISRFHARVQSTARSSAQTQSSAWSRSSDQARSSDHLGSWRDDDNTPTGADTRPEPSDAAQATPASKPKGLDRYEKARLRQRIKELEAEIAGLEEEEALTTGMLSDPKTYAGENATETIKGLDACLRYIHERLPEALREWEEAGRALEEGGNTPAP